MFGPISRAVEGLQRSWSEESDDEAIRRACVEAGHAWRERKLDPVRTVKLFLLQVLWGNAACNHLPHPANEEFTGAAYCEARGRLPLAALESLLTRSTARMAECVRETGRRFGHRLFVIDGSTFSMPDTPALRERFGQHDAQRPGCGFPTAHFPALVHFGSGLFQKVAVGSWRTHDLSDAPELHPELEPDDVLLGDRAFCSFAHLALLTARGVHGLFRLHQRMVADFTPGRPHADPRGGKNRDKKGLPRSRWLERLGDDDQLKPMDRPAWLKELTMFLVAYNLVRMTMLEAARRQDVEPERISFVDAPRWSATANRHDELPKLVVLPRRPDRYEPRARKRRPKTHNLMNKPLAVLREALRAQSLTH